MQSLGQSSNPTMGTLVGSTFLLCVATVYVCDSMAYMTPPTFTALSATMQFWGEKTAGMSRREPAGVPYRGPGPRISMGRTRASFVLGSLGLRMGHPGQHWKM